MLNKAAFLASGPTPIFLPERSHWPVVGLPRGINILLLDPRKAKATRNHEGELRPTIVSGNGNEGTSYFGSFTKWRPAQSLSL